MQRRFGWIVLLPLFLAMGCEESDTSGQRSAGPAGQPRARVWVKREFLEQAADEQVEAVLLTCLNNAIKGDYEHEAEIVRSWTPGKRMLYATSQMEGEVNNGGFVQYFWNTENEFSQMALEGLQLIGAQKHADLMQRAMQIYKEEESQYFQHRTGDSIESLEQAEKNSALNRVDAEFYELTEDLTALRVKFVREHLDEFATPS
ncbi:MAG: DMP19 family protein [Phycisphaerae bacterium]|nr:DMP19 family protein [Phycisphaerae bacterium]